MLTRKRAAVLFSFKRVYNILCCVKQVLGAVVANFLGEFIGKPGRRSHFIGWTVGGDPYSNFGKLAPENVTNNKMYGVLVTNIREHRV